MCCNLYLIRQVLKVKYILFYIIVKFILTTNVELHRNCYRFDYDRI